MSWLNICLYCEMMTTHELLLSAWYTAADVSFPHDVSVLKSYYSGNFRLCGDGLIINYNQSSPLLTITSFPGMTY